MTAYPWLVFLHIVGVLVFAFGHGTSAVVAFKDPRGARVCTDRGAAGGLAA